MSSLTHLDEQGRARMVDVGGKPETARKACAFAEIRIGPAFRTQLLEGKVPKGDAYAAARLAGIQAAKKTGDWIPLCHPLGLDHASVEFRTLEDRILIKAEAACTGKTGVEMEALTAASAAALTFYDMGKAVDREMAIGPIYLGKKTGGRSGAFERSALPEGARPWE